MAIDRYYTLCSKYCTCFVLLVFLVFPSRQRGGQIVLPVLRLCVYEYEVRSSNIWYARRVKPSTLYLILI
jgi:hypothetical protein